MTVDYEKVEAFLDRFMGDLAASAHAATVTVGEKLGLYKALAKGGPQTPAELAARTDLQPRLVEEWVNAQAASDYCVHDPATDRYWLTSEQAFCLADDTSPAYIAPQMGIASALHKDEERVRSAFMGESTFGWHEHHHDLFDGLNQSSQIDYLPLIPEWIPALRGVEAKLRSGARIADIGCGYGVPTILMAQAYPSSVFAGFDYHSHSIDAARKAAAEAGVSDRVTFEVAAGSDFPGDGYDLICTFDAIHDMGDPVGVARHMRTSLAPDGTWLIVELNAGDAVEDNHNPMGRLLYSASTFICVPNALSQGAGRPLGAAAGEARLRAMAAEAGFTRFCCAAESPLNLVLEASP